METWSMRKSNTPLRLDRGHELVDSGIIIPVTLTFIVTSLQHCDLDSFSRLLLLDTITGMSTTLLHELDLWNLLHDLTWSRHRPCH